LQDQIGAPAFDAFLRQYTETFAWKIATPEALQTLAEQNCACDLDGLFKEWVYSS
jgi:aminopeptidase N